MTENPFDELDKHVTCLECGTRLKVLNKSHLKTHGMTVKEYDAKYPTDPDSQNANKEIDDSTHATVVPETSTAEAIPDPKLTPEEPFVETPEETTDPVAEPKPSRIDRKINPRYSTKRRVLPVSKKQQISMPLMQLDQMHPEHGSIAENTKCDYCGKDLFGLFVHFAITDQEARVQMVMEPKKPCHRECIRYTIERPMIGQFHKSSQ